MRFVSLALCLALILNLPGWSAYRAFAQSLPSEEALRISAEKEFMDLLGVRLAPSSGREAVSAPGNLAGAASGNAARGLAPSSEAAQAPFRHSAGGRETGLGMVVGALALAAPQGMAAASQAAVIPTVLKAIVDTVIGVVMTFGPPIAIAVVAGFILKKIMEGGMISKTWAKPERPQTRFADVAGLDEAVVEMGEVVDMLKNPGKYEKLGIHVPRGVMLFGPSGTGKTLLARAVAGEAGVPFFSVTGSSFVEMYVGKGAARVRALFDSAKKEARKGPVVIFIDEIDSLGRSRSRGDGDSGSQEFDHALNALLAEIDGFESAERILVLGATNRLDLLDPALLRSGRFDRHVSVDPPDVKGREAILKVHVRHLEKQGRLGPDVDLKTVAQRTPGLVGADMASIVREAATLAARKNKALVEMKDFEEAVDRVLMGPELKSRVMSPKEREIAAYHESGHTLAAFSNDKADPVHKVSIIPRGKALGVTMQLPQEDKRLRSQGELEAMLAVLLGGMAAEEIVFGEVTTGSSDDLAKVRQVAYAMVRELGMNKEVGPINFRDGQPSEATSQLMDEEAKKLVKSTYEKVKSLLQARRAKLDALAKDLILKETLTGDEIRKLLEREDL